MFNYYFGHFETHVEFLVCPFFLYDFELNLIFCYSEAQRHDLRSYLDDVGYFYLENGTPS